MLFIGIIHELLNSTLYWKDYDIFHVNKLEAMINSKDAILEQLNKIQCMYIDEKSVSLKTEFSELLQVRYFWIDL